MPDRPGHFLAHLWTGWIATWPTELLALIWIAWLVSWVVASFWSGRTQTRVRTWDAQAYRLPILAGAILFTPWTAQALGEKPLWHFGAADVYALVGLTLLGISFTWWARIHLGRLWSSAITRKEDHHIIDTGPYGLVRHPIYTGLITGLLSTSIAVGMLTTLLGALLMCLGVWQKARMEEGFLRTELGAEIYDAYCRRTPMLIPFLPLRRRSRGA
jgi:protein-S-isoprenylcysteine O-methyltransferase Ste14